MQLVRLIYSSEVVQPFSQSEILSLIEKAKVTNDQKNITGLLCFNHEYFLQCLEGDRDDVNEIYTKILNDPRHRNAVILNYKEIEKREFSQWSMGYIPSTHITKPLNLKYSGTPYFEPHKMSGESCHQLMMEVKETVPVV